MPNIEAVLTSLLEARKVLDAYLVEPFAPRTNDPYATRDEIYARLEAAEQVDAAILAVRRLNPQYAESALVSRRDDYVGPATYPHRGPFMSGRSR